MDAGTLLHQLPIFLVFLCLSFVFETSIAQKPPPEVIWQNERLPYEQDYSIFSSPGSESQLDVTPGAVPIVNPTTPTTTPIVNPTSPPAPTFPEPVTNPNPNPNPNPNANPNTNPNPNPNPTTNPNPNPNPTTNPPASSSGGSWCVANPTASSTTLQVALDYACGYGGADCSGIQPGAPCYDPNTVKDHASYAFNDYYQKNPVPTSCVFGGAAQLSSTDPSYGNCHFASSSGKTPTQTPPPTPTTPTTTVPMTPPSTTTTPINPYAPNGPTGYGGTEPTDYGSEPTGTPNSAMLLASSNNLLLQLLVVTSLMLWVTTANYL